jgi:hypothetical protein
VDILLVNRKPRVTVNREVEKEDTEEKGERRRRVTLLIVAKIKRPENMQDNN